MSKKKEKKDSVIQQIGRTKYWNTHLNIQKQMISTGGEMVTCDDEMQLKHGASLIF